MTANLYALCHHVTDQHYADLRSDSRVSSIFDGDDGCVVVAVPIPDEGVTVNFELDEITIREQSFTMLYFSVPDRVLWHAAEISEDVFSSMMVDNVFFSQMSMDEVETVEELLVTVLE